MELKKDGLNIVILASIVILGIKILNTSKYGN